MESLIATTIILSVISVFVTAFVLVNEREAFELDAKELNDKGYEIRLNAYLDDPEKFMATVKAALTPSPYSVPRFDQPTYYPSFKAGCEHLKVNAKHFPEVNLEKIFN